MMDDSYAPDLDRAARRREQNRIAQRNHRRRKQLAQQNLSQQHQQQPQSQPQQQQHHQDPQQLWAPDWRTTHNDENSLFSSKQGGGMNDTDMGGLQDDLLDVFDSIVQEPPSPNWHPEQIYPSPSLEDDSPRNMGGTANKTMNLQPVMMNPERRTPNAPSRARRERLPNTNVSPTSSSSFHPTAPPTSISRAPSVASELSTRSSRLQQISPESLDHLDREDLERPTLGSRRTSSIHQQRNRRPRERNDYPPRQPSGETHGQTCLHLAAAEGSTQLVRYFLGRGMRPNTRDGDGLTALHHAIRGGYEDTVSELLLGGADIEVTDSRGRTALHYAVEQRQDDIVVMLIHKGADMHATVARPIRRPSR